MKTRLEQISEVVLSGDERKKLRGIEELSRMKGEAPEDLLIKLSGDEKWEVRRFAMEAIVSRATHSTASKVIKALEEGKNAALRNAAIEILNRLSTKAMKEIIAALPSPDPDVRLQLVAILGRTRHHKAVSALVAMLEDPDPNVLTNTITALGLQRDWKTTPYLLDILHGENEWYKIHAMEALGESGDPSAIGEIIEHASNKGMKRAAVKALGNIGCEEGLPFLRREIAHDAGLEPHALAALFKTATHPIYSILRPETPSEVREILRESVTTEHYRELKSGLDSPNRDLCRASSFAVGILCDRLDMETLIRASEGEGKADFFKGMKMNRGESPECLRKLLRQSKDSETREEIMDLMVESGAHRFHDDALAVLEHGDTLEMTQGAIKILAASGIPEDMTALLRSLSLEEELLIEPASNALEMIGHRAGKKKKNFHKILLDFFEGGSPSQRAVALESLVKSGEEEYRDLLFLSLNDPSPLVRETSVSLIPLASLDEPLKLISPALADENLNVRHRAISSLKKLRSEGVSDFLRLAADDPDTWIRVSAIKALSGLKDKETEKKLLQAARSDTPPVIASAAEPLARLGSRKGRKALFEMISSENTEIRRSAVAALSFLGHDASKQPLIEALNDKDWTVRKAAVGNLGEMEDEETLSILKNRLKKEKDSSVKLEIIRILFMKDPGDNAREIRERLKDPEFFEFFWNIMKSFPEKGLKVVENPGTDTDNGTALFLEKLKRALKIINMEAP